MSIRLNSLNCVIGSFAGSVACKIVTEVHKGNIY